MNKKLPNWVIAVPELRRWAKTAGIDMFTGNTAQVLFRDMGDPVGSSFSRPLMLARDGRTILGTFRIEKKDRHEYVIGPWFKTMKLFVLDVPAEFFPLIADNPAIEYIEGERRTELKNRIALVEKKEWTAKPQKPSLLPEPLAWRSIFLPNAKPLEGPSPSFFPPALVPVSR
jgi:hypothetical protein